MRVCLVYDCLFPHTVGGAERWYRSLAERLVADGHEVSYLTLRQWERGTDPGVAGWMCGSWGRGCRCTPKRDGDAWPPLVFGAGVFWHLLRHGKRYDVVHTCSFPYFSLLAAAPSGRSGAIGWWSIGLRRGPRATGANISAQSQATSVGSCSDCARASRSGPSVSPGFTPAAARRRRARRDHSVSWRLRWPARRSSQAHVRPAGAVCGPPHSREARVGDRASDSPSAGPDCQKSEPR